MNQPVDFSLLDNFEFMQNIDSENMLDALNNFPQQLREIAQILQKAPVLIPPSRSIYNICLLGMGGSAIAGFIAEKLYSNDFSVPFIVNNDYVLPHWVNKNTFVIANSYSGNTDETVFALTEAQRRGAFCSAISTGGKVEDFAQKNELFHLKIPGGLQPRAALGYSFFALAHILQKAQLIAQRPQIDWLINFLEEKQRKLAPEFPAEKNYAKYIAQFAYGKIPIIYADSPYFQPVAYRWKCQFNENSKNPAFSASFPEMNHNEIMGWHFGQNHPLTERFAVLFLRDVNSAKHYQQRITATQQILQNNEIPFLEIYADGQTELEKFFSIIYLGDFATVYLAFLNQVNPTEINNIQFLKKQLQMEAAHE